MSLYVQNTPSKFRELFSQFHALLVLVTLPTLRTDPIKFKLTSTSAKVIQLLQKKVIQPTSRLQIHASVIDANQLGNNCSSRVLHSRLKQWTPELIKMCVELHKFLVKCMTIAWKNINTNYSYNKYLSDSEKELQGTDPLCST